MKKIILLSILLIVGCEEPVAPDTTAPTVVITYPVNNSTLDSTITIKADVADDSDISSVKFLIDGTEAYADSTAPYEYVWDVCVQSTGNHTVLVKAEDSAGNKGQSDLLTFTLDASYDCTSVCGGSDLSCVDCAGVFNGTSTRDNCEVCDSDSTNDCSLDACGIWGGDGYNGAGLWCEDINVLQEIITLNSLTTIVDNPLNVWDEWDVSGRLIEFSNNPYNITILPESIGNLENLKSLAITSSLTNIPQSVGNLSNLEELYLGFTNAPSIPEQITNLTKLTYLYLAGNPFTSIPDNIGNLINLEYLNVSNCQLTSLPESLGNLNNLKELFVRENQLTTLPESIGNLTNLIQLSAHENNLVSIPESICNLSDANVQLGGNKLCEEFNFECTENWGWGTLGLPSQDQSNCDCAGVTGGDAVIDDCGVCDGDGSTCEGLWNVYYDVDVPISGFQFQVNGGTLVNASGGAASDAGLSVSTGSSTVLAFSLSGVTIPSGNGTLISLELVGDANSFCISNLVLSNIGGESIPAIIEDCNTIKYSDD